MGPVGFRRQVLIAGFAALLAAVLALYTAAPSAATYPGGNGRIIFTESNLNATASTALWSINPDGTGLQLVTRVQSAASRAFVTFPSVSADGSRLAVLLVEFFDDAVECGPRFPQHVCDSVVVMDIDGSNQRVILSDWRIASRAISLSPDGTQVAVPLTDSGVRPTGAYINLVDVDTGRIKRVTRAPGTTLSVSDSDPSFAPDGSAIAFTSNRDSATTGSSWSTFLVPTLGAKKIERLLPDSSGNDLYPDWGPDGSRLVFVRTFSSPFADAVYTVSRDGTGERELLRASGTVHSPAFSPDGTQIAFVHSGQLRLMSEDGTNQRTLTTGGSFGFTWVPED